MFSSVFSREGDSGPGVGVRAFTARTRIQKKWKDEVSSVNGADILGSELGRGRGRGRKGWSGGDVKKRRGEEVKNERDSRDSLPTPPTPLPTITITKPK